MRKECYKTEEIRRQSQERSTTDEGYARRFTMATRWVGQGRRRNAKSAAKSAKMGRASVMGGDFIEVAGRQKLLYFEKQQFVRQRTEVANQERSNVVFVYKERIEFVEEV